MLDKPRTHRFEPAEQVAYAPDGFIDREGVFSRDECAAIAADCEALITDLEAVQPQPGRGRLKPAATAISLAT